jgi:hypothetical protein
MTIYQLFLLLLAGFVVIAVPIGFVWTFVAHLRTRASQRPGSGSQTAGIGAAMQELDRILARPSVEHTVEAETPVLKREDDEAGD